MASLPLSANLSSEELENLSRKLRDQLDNLFERIRSFTFEEPPVEEQFMMLVSRYPEEALQRAVLMTAVETPDVSFSGRLPIHLACDNNAPIGIIRWLLDSDPGKSSIQKPDSWG